MDATRVLIAQHRAIESLFDDAMRETRRRPRVHAISRLADELIAHMAAEEAVFYPAARRFLDVAADTTEHAPNEHLLLRIELRHILETGAERFLSERIEGLRALFMQHLRVEEGDLFPRLVRAVSAVKLEALGAEIIASRPPVWIVSTEGRALVRSGDQWALRSRVSLDIPSRK